jgi:hypothetical protein
MPVLAIGGVELVAFIVAIMAILLLFAGQWLFKLISAVLSHLPLVGGYIASVVGGWLATEVGNLAHQLDNQVFGMAHFLWSTAVGLWHIVNQMTTAIGDAKLWGVGAWSHAENLVSSLFDTFTGQLGRDLIAINNEIGAVEALGAGAVATAEQYAAALVASATAGIAGQISDVSSEANRLFGEAEAAAVAGTAEAEALAHALADEVQSEAVTLFGQAEGAITVIQGQIQALPGQIEGVIPGIIDGIVPGIIAGAIPGILSQVIPRVQALEGEVTECLEPLCDTVTPQAPRLGKLGQLFQDLEGLAVEAVILALAAEAVHNPQAVVSDITGVVQDVGGGALSGFRDLVGV